MPVPEAWESVALELPDGARVATQELSRKEPILFDSEIRGDEVDDLFRRFHGREIFDHAWNGYRIEGRTLTLEVDDDPDPAWLDVDGLRAEVTVALRSAPDRDVEGPDRGTRPPNAGRVDPGAGAGLDRGPARRGRRRDRQPGARRRATGARCRTGSCR